MEKKTYTYVNKLGIGTPYTFASDSKIYALVRGVSKSGMSRRLSFFTIEDGGLRDITHVIAQCLGYTLNEHEWSFRVIGCGMDMIAHTLDCFASKIGYEKTPTWVYHYGKI